MRKYIITPIVYGWLGLCLIACSTDHPKSSNEMAVALPFQQLIDSFYTAHPETKGILLHVEAPDIGLSWSGATGTVSPTDTTPLQPNDPALIASITKTYVAAAIIRLVEQEKLELHQPIAGLVSAKSEALLLEEGYKVQAITLAHLLSNTSGIFDFVSSPNFQRLTVTEPQHIWTRDEQIAMAMTDGKPLGPPGTQFSYSETNFLLLTEVMEQFTGRPFPTAMRELLKYEILGLSHTWFPLLEETPADLPPLIQQFATQLQVNSYDLHVSADLFGGGGIAATTADVARFSQALFEGKIFDRPETLDLIYTEIQTQDSIPPNYYMGLAKMEVNGHPTYGHGGFWGTTMRYIPHLNTSVAVFLRERDAWETYNVLLGDVITLLEQTQP